MKSDLVSLDSAENKLARRLRPGVRKHRDQKMCPLTGKHLLLVVSAIRHEMLRCGHATRVLT